jgi:hypothetical protein
LDGRQLHVRIDWSETNNNIGTNAGTDIQHWIISPPGELIETRPLATNSIQTDAGMTLLSDAGLAIPALSESDTTVWAQSTPTGSFIEWFETRPTPV